MDLKTLKKEALLGEDSKRQFKSDIKNIDSLASEMAAFANSEGGIIFIGISDNGTIQELGKEDVSRINQLISNAANQHVRSPITVQTENVALSNKRIVIVLKIPKGIDKPYFDKNGVIWLKSGSDKRRVNSKEELCRVFQSVHQFHADELPTTAGVEQLDKLRFRDFLRDIYQQKYPDSKNELIKLLQNMNLAVEKGFLNLAGVLLFAERPEWIKPQFIVKAICYPGNDIHETKYSDTEDFSGTMKKIFDGAMGFVMRNLRKIQSGGINSPGIPEISAIVFEELLVNALVHRDYFISAPVRIFIFDNRVEIISPGNLPNNLTVEKILAGNSNIRNPILVSYIAKGILPYRGIGSGIKRAVKDYSDIEFRDDREGNLFIATVYRKTVPIYKQSSDIGSDISSDISSEESSEKIIKIIESNPKVSAKEIGKHLGISSRAVEKHISKLREAKYIDRVGSKKYGHWIILKQEGSDIGSDISSEEMISGSEKMQKIPEKKSNG